MKRKSAGTFIFDIILVILSMALISEYFIPEMYASYYSKASGTACASVAKWDIAVTGDNENPAILELDGKENNPAASYTLTVTNRSETTAECIITLSLTDSGSNVPKDLQEGMTITLFHGEEQVPLDKSDNEAGVYRTSYPITVIMGASEGFTILVYGGAHGTIVENQDLNLSAIVTITQKD